MRKYEAKLVDSSRLIADHLVDDIGIDSGRFEEMLLLVLQDKYPLSMRAARIIAISCEKYPQLINDHIGLIIDKLPYLKIDGVKRGLLKIFADNPPQIDEDQIGLLTDLAFTWLEDHKQAIAIRYYSIEIICFVCTKYPELRYELAVILKGMENDSSAGIRSICRKILKEFEREGVIK